MQGNFRDASSFHWNARNLTARLCSDKGHSLIIPTTRNAVQLHKISGSPLPMHGGRPLSNFKNRKQASPKSSEQKEICWMNPGNKLFPGKISLCWAARGALLLLLLRCTPPTGIHWEIVRGFEVGGEKIPSGGNPLKKILEHAGFGFTENPLVALA